MANQTINRGTPFYVTAAGTASAQAVAPLTTFRYYVTDISGSSSGGTTGTWGILGGATGTTILWQGAGPVNASFGSAIINPTLGTISLFVNGTTLTYASISGYYI